MKKIFLYLGKFSITTVVLFLFVYFGLNTAFDLNKGLPFFIFFPVPYIFSLIAIFINLLLAWKRKETVLKSELHVSLLCVGLLCSAVPLVHALNNSPQTMDLGKLVASTASAISCVYIMILSQISVFLLNPPEQNRK